LDASVIALFMSFILGFSSYASSSSSIEASRSWSAELSGSTRKVPRFRSWKDFLNQIVLTGLQKFDVSSPKELQDYLTYVTHEMDRKGIQYFIFRKYSGTQLASVFVLRVLLVLLTDRHISAIPFNTFSGHYD